MTKDSFKWLAGSFDREPERRDKGTKDVVISNILFLLLAVMFENSNSHLPVETQPFLKSHIRRGNYCLVIYDNDEVDLGDNRKDGDGEKGRHYKLVRSSSQFISPQREFPPKLLVGSYENGGVI